VFVCVLHFTSRSDSGVLSPSGKCCSRANTMQLAMMVVKIIHSNGVRGKVKAHIKYIYILSEKKYFFTIILKSDSHHKNL